MNKQCNFKKFKSYPKDLSLHDSRWFSGYCVKCNVQTEYCEHVEKYLCCQCCTGNKTILLDLGNFKVKSLFSHPEYDLIENVPYEVIDGVLFADLLFRKPLVNKIRNIDDLNEWAYETFDGFFVKII